MKLFTLIILFAFAALFGAIAPAPAASLRTQTIVEGDVVRLGDVFEDAGQYAQMTVINAPAPGRRLTLDVNWLMEAARIYKVAWRPSSRFDRVVVERAGKIISAAELMSPLRSELLGVGMPTTSVVEFNNRSVEVSLPLNVPASIEVRNLSYDPYSSRFSALLLVGGEGPGHQRVMVQGRAYTATPVAVLKRAVNPGEIIRKTDIEVVHRREDMVGQDIVTDPARLVGTTPRARLRAGEPIRETDTRAPTMVSRNSQVVIKLESGPMTLTAQGRALDEGARGDVVRVLNLQSNKTIEATVAGPDTVIIGLAPRTAAIN